MRVALTYFSPIRPADEIYNVKPLSRMKKQHEEAGDATDGPLKAGEKR